MKIGLDGLELCRGVIEQVPKYWLNNNSPEPTFMSLNYHILNLKGIFICSRPGNNDYHVGLTKATLVVWDGPWYTLAEATAETETGFIGKLKYQLTFVHSQPPVLVGVLLSIYLSIYLLGL